jgi:hypothetical protein
VAESDAITSSGAELVMRVVDRKAIIVPPPAAQSSLASYCSGQNQISQQPK